MGDKDRELLEYFNMCSQTTRETSNGVNGIGIGSLPKVWKTYPDLEEARSYLAGWLAGYIAADGSVSSNGTVTLYSTDRNHLAYTARVANRLGITTYDVGEYERTISLPGNYVKNGNKQTIYHLPFARSSMDEKYILLSTHKNNHEKRNNSLDMVRWRVDSVEHTTTSDVLYTPLEDHFGVFSLMQGVSVYNPGDNK